MYPRLEIKVAGILHNYHTLHDLGARHGVHVSLVTKGLVGDLPLIEQLVAGGVDSICDAHLKNLRKYEGLDVEKWMIRPVLPSQVGEIVRYANVSLNTELRTLQLLNEAAGRAGVVHKVVLMLELGDGREGCLPDELVELCQYAERAEHLYLYGIGTSLSCLNDTIPDESNMAELLACADDVEAAIGRRLDVISGGNSSSVHMLVAGTLPPRINHLRLGESILNGNIAMYDDPIPDASLDHIKLCAEIIEVKDKPSVPHGPRVAGAIPIADDPSYTDIGIRRHAIVAIGTQDTKVENLAPTDPAMRIIGGTSDCFVVDVTDCERNYRVGDIVQFTIGYYALLQAMTSHYVEKILL